MLEVMRDILQSRYVRSNVAHKQLARTSLNTVYQRYLKWVLSIKYETRMARRLSSPVISTLPIYIFDWHSTQIFWFYFLTQPTTP